mgnify:CR=1 FL=1
MRLQAEEQNEQVMSRMVLTQKQLEQQIRNLTGKGKTVTNLPGAVGGRASPLGANGISNIESYDNTVNEGAQN